MPRKKSSSNSSNYFKKDNNNNVNKKRKRKTTIINNNNATSSPKRISLGDKQYKVESFKHIIGNNNSKPHTLLVGTMPSITSHGLSQYYGHRNNAFWWIISDKFNYYIVLVNTIYLQPRTCSRTDLLPQSASTSVVWRRLRDGCGSVWDLASQPMWLYGTVIEKTCFVLSRGSCHEVFWRDREKTER